MKMFNILLLLTCITALQAWELKESQWSEGVQTNLVVCDDGTKKAVYYTDEKGRYEVSPSVSFDTLDEAAEFICKPK